jgi:RNA-directed DNA polymerase
MSLVMMHRPIAEQGRYLARVLNGFFNYFAVPTNSRAINWFYRHVGWYCSGGGARSAG